MLDGRGVGGAGERGGRGGLDQGLGPSQGQSQPQDQSQTRESKRLHKPPELDDVREGETPADRLAEGSRERLMELYALPRNLKRGDSLSALVAGKTHSKYLGSQAPKHPGLAAAERKKALFSSRSIQDQSCLQQPCHGAKIGIKPFVAMLCALQVIVTLTGHGP
jgi:hypothetical protein